MRCRRLVVAFTTSTDQEMGCSGERTYFYTNIKKKVEKNYYAAKVDHDDV